MFDAEKRLVLKTALEIKANGLVSLSGGNVSLRLPGGRFLVTPSGMIYDDMTPGDVVLIDDQCRVVEGCRRPSSDSAALVYMFRHMPWVNAIIHTHQPYATAAGFVTDVIPAFLVTLIDANRGAVNVAPFTPSSDVGMGRLAVQYAGSAWAVVLRHHGVMAYGPTMKDALYSAVYLEEACKTYMAARAVGPVPALDPRDIETEAAGWLSYGQPAAETPQPQEEHP